jgi:hypothetical protein
MNARQARDGLPPRQRLRAMFVIEIALAMSVLDGAIANIALPTDRALLRERSLMRGGRCGRR